jgi:hypothetical protein
VSSSHHGRAKPAGRFHQLLDQRLGDLGGRRFSVARATTLATVAEQGELRDHREPATRIEQRAVHLAGLVLEDPQMDQLLGQLRGIRRAVFDRHADQRKQARAHLGNPLALHLDRTARHTLRDGPHGPVWSEKRPRYTASPSVRSSTI